MITKVDVLVIGGGMANTFLKAQGLPIGKSLHEPALLDKAREIMAAAKARGCVIVLPTDGVVAKEFKAMAEAKTLPVARTPDDGMILDVGSDTIASIAGRLETAKTVVWNGPLGAFETPPFDLGHQCGRAPRRDADESGRDGVGRRRRGHVGGAGAGGRRGRFHVLLDGGRCVFGMA